MHMSGSKCGVCKNTDSVLTICLACSGEIDFNQLVVLASINGSRTGLTVTQISMRTKYHRNTIGRYVKALERKGLIMIKYHGNTKVCQRPPEH